MQTGNSKKQRKKCEDPVPVDQIIQQGQLKSLIEKAKLLQSLNARLMDILPEARHPYCQVANIRDHKLIIHAETATHATLLRYQTPHLLSGLKSHEESDFIRTIEYKVRP